MTENNKVTHSTAALMKHDKVSIVLETIPAERKSKEEFF